MRPPALLRREDDALREQREVQLAQRVEIVGQSAADHMPGTALDLGHPGARLVRRAGRRDQSAMADVHVVSAGSLRDPLKRSRRFIYFGLGQEKLHLEHLESQGIDNETTRSQRAWIDAQRYTFVTDVNVGAWSETSVRKMAKEADLLDFYRFRYHPLSAAAHSMWNHVATFNLRPCTNPLHRYHHVPEIPDLPPDIGLWDMTAGLLRETFALFDAAFAISVALTSSVELLDEALADYAAS